MGTQASIFESIHSSKSKLLGLYSSQAKDYAEHFEEFYSLLEDNFKNETESLRNQIDSLRQQFEAMTEHVLGKKDYAKFMET